jgi:hypothetical protein
MSWPALLLAPVFALASVALGYALVTPACERAQVWPLHAAVLVFFVLCAASTLAAWRAPRAFLPRVATWCGAFSTAVILLQWTALFIVPPCMHSP